MEFEWALVAWEEIYETIVFNFEIEKADTKKFKQVHEGVQAGPTTRCTFPLISIGSLRWHQLNQKHLC